MDQWPLLSFTPPLLLVICGEFRGFPWIDFPTSDLWLHSCQMVELLVLWQSRQKSILLHLSGRVLYPRSTLTLDKFWILLERRGTYSTLRKRSEELVDPTDGLLLCHSLYSSLLDEAVCRSVVERVKQWYPGSVLFAAGWSLGGAALSILHLPLWWHWWAFPPDAPSVREERESPTYAQKQLLVFKCGTSNPAVGDLHGKLILQQISSWDILERKGGKRPSRLPLACAIRLIW